MDKERRGVSLMSALAAASFASSGAGPFVLRNSDYPDLGTELWPSERRLPRYRKAKKPKAVIARRKANKAARKARKRS